MPQPIPPPPPSTAQARSNRWFYGCAIGCGAFLVLAAVAVTIILVVVIPRFEERMEAGKTEIAEVLEADYAKLKESGKIPAEHEPLFDELVAIGQNDETGFFTLTLIVGVIVTTTQDGEVSEQELEDTNDLLAFARANPDANVVQLGFFLQNHPHLHKAFEDDAKGNTSEAEAAEH